MKIIISIIIYLTFCLISIPAISVAGNMALPTGYTSWNHVKSMVIKKGHPLFDPFGGIHHVYANQKAVQGYKMGKFPSGSVIVFDLYKATNDGNAITEGSRKFIGVMEKRSGIPETGGWAYEVFAGDKLKAKGVNGAQSCHGCHSDAAGKDFVFSTMKK